MNQAYIDLGIELRVKEKTATTYSKAPLLKIKGMPATGQAGGTVDITTSSDPVKVYIPDRPDTGDMDFTYNYTAENYGKAKAVCDGTERDILIKLPDGASFEYSGTLQTWTNEVSVGGSPIEGTLHTVPSSEPNFLSAEQTTAKISTTTD